MQNRSKEQCTANWTDLCWKVKTVARSEQGKMKKPFSVDSFRGGQTSQGIWWFKFQSPKCKMHLEYVQTGKESKSRKAATNQCHQPLLLTVKRSWRVLNWETMETRGGFLGCDMSARLSKVARERKCNISVRIMNWKKGAQGRKRSYAHPDNP